MIFEKWIVVRGKVFWQFRLPFDNGIKHEAYFNSTGVFSMNGEVNNPSTKLVKDGDEGVGL